MQLKDLKYRPPCLLRPLQAGVAFYYEKEGQAMFMRNGPVKVTDAMTGQLKRWETTRGKPMAVMDNGTLVLTRVGKHMGYKVSNKELVKN